MKNKFFTYIQNLQDTIVAGLETVDGQAKFKEDLWERPEGGGGRTRVIENGNVFEKGGVNISAVHGKLRSHAKNVWRRRSRFFCLRTKFGVTSKKPYGSYGSCQLALFRNVR